MSMVNFKYGLVANLPAERADGTMYITTNERGVYFDVPGGDRIRIGDFQRFANVAALEANANPSTTALYYVEDINCLAMWDGSAYQQINRDTGATAFEVVGDGNVITGVSYNAEARKLTLTKGMTAATPGDVDNKIAAKVGELGEKTVKQYVDDATAGIASDAALTALGERVTTAEGAIDAVEALVGEKAVSTQIDEKIEALKLAETYEAIGAAAAVQGETESTVAEVESALNTFKGETNTAIESAKTELKSYADTAEADALAAAKTYADGKDAAIEAAKKAGDDAAAALETYKGVNDPLVKAAQDAADAAQEDVDALAAKVGEVPADKTVVGMIAEAQTAATYDDTQVKADIKTNADAITKLNANADTEGSVDYKIAQAVAAIMENPDETMNSINELVTWCNDHASDALELSNKVSANEGDIAALEALVGETAVATQITDAIAAALKIEGVDKYALASDLTAAIARIVALEKDTHTHANKAELDLIASGDKAKWDAAVADVATVKGDYLKAADKTELSGLITAEKERAEGVEGGFETRIAAMEAIDHTHTFNETELNKVADGDVAKWNTAATDASAIKADYLKSADKTELSEAITTAQTAAEKVANDNNTAMDNRVKVLEAIDHDAYIGYADQAEADAKAHAENLLTWGTF